MMRREQPYESWVSTWTWARQKKIVVTSKLESTSTRLICEFNVMNTAAEEILLCRGKS